CRVPVLRKGALNVRGLAQLAVAAALAVRRQVALLRLADVVYVNTVTIPTWEVLARLWRKRVVVHVHEAEDDLGRLLTDVLLAPVLSAHLAVCNSRATEA